MKLKTQDLRPGHCVRLLDYGQTDLSYRRRLLALGLTPGVDVHVVRRAPLGCPLQVTVRGTSLLLREDDVAALSWEYVSCAWC